MIPWTTTMDIPHRINLAFHNQLRHQSQAISTGKLVSIGRNISLAIWKQELLP